MPDEEDNEQCIATTREQLNRHEHAATKTRQQEANKCPKRTMKNKSSKKKLRGLHGIWYGPGKWLKTSNKRHPRCLHSCLPLCNRFCTYSIVFARFGGNPFRAYPSPEISHYPPVAISRLPFCFPDKTTTKHEGRVRSGEVFAWITAPRPKHSQQAKSIKTKNKQRTPERKVCPTSS